MPFYFYCPLGHLLEGQETMVGQQSGCPVCGQLFVVPAPGPPAAPAWPGMPAPAPSYQPPYPGVLTGGWPGEMGAAGMAPGAIPASAAAGQAEPELDVSALPNFGAAAPEMSPDDVPATPAAPAEPPPPKLLHIPCPKGHQLETPEEMFGLEAQCPICSEQFVLRPENSVEHVAAAAEKQRVRDEKLSRFWLKISIGAAIAGAVGILAAVVYSLVR